MFLPDFQVVLLSSGFSPQLYPIAEETPKCLLPVANRPLISYQLELLERTGFQEIIIITDDFAATKLTNYLTESYKGKITYELIIFHEEQLGTAEILSRISNKIRSDFFVISGDLLIDETFLLRMANTHRITDAAVTLLLNQNTTSKKSKGSVDYIGFDSNTKRVVYYKPSSEISDIRLTKSFLHRYPDVTIYNNLYDVHFYIFSRWVIDTLPEASSYFRVPLTSVRRHLVPYLIHLQFTEKKTELEKIEDKHKLLVNQMTSTRIEEWPLCQGFVVNSTKESFPSKDAPIKLFCARVDSPAAYLEINHNVANKASSFQAAGTAGKNYFFAPSAVLEAPIGAGCVIGESTKVGKDSNLKKAIVGNNCVIGERVRISNSVLMDNVILKDGSEVSDSVLCNGVTVMEGAVVRDSQLGAGYKVSPKQSIISQRELKNLSQFK